MKKSIIRHSLWLATFALATTAAVALVNHLTQPIIAEQAKAHRLNVLQQVVPSHMHDEPLTQYCTLLSDSPLSNKPSRVYQAYVAGQVTAYAIEVDAPDGYNGLIKILVGVDKQQNILGVRTLNHQETPGLGDKIELSKSDWVLSFNGFNYQGADDHRLYVDKDGGQFDAFTGATITPRAYIKALRTALSFSKDQLESALSNGGDCGE